MIKGSERITDWEKRGDGLWQVVIKNAFFGTYNPYKEIIWGDWLMSPTDYSLHTGQVYLNGTALSEKAEISELRDMCWYCESRDESTAICANFGDNNPNEELAEINVRPFCFKPMYTGTDYITVRGFEMAHAATQWSPPTAEQTGMICTNWSRGWIIEN